MSHTETLHVKPSGAGLPAFILGVAMSGFFDGILLHQVLQWHHLLSLVPGRAFEDPRVQVFADGVFHVLMYLLAAAGLLMFWLRRSALAASGRGMLAAFIGGFGAWNVVDVVLFHWLLRTHNLRLDVPNPVAWDLAWLAVFGVLPLMVAAVVMAGGARPPSNRRRTALTLAILTFGAGVWALAPAKSATTAVLFRPGLSEVQKWRAIARADARFVASDASGDLVVVSLPSGMGRWGLFADGALVVGGAMGGGCLTAISSVSRQATETSERGDT